MPAYKDNERGTWYAKYSVFDHVTGKRKQVLKRGFKTKRYALEYEHMQKMNIAHSSVTFGELSAKYFEYRKQTAKTQDKYTAMLQKYAPPASASVSDLSKADMMQWYLNLDKQNLKPSTKNLVLTVTKSVFKYGHDFYDLPNPAGMLKRFKDNKKEFGVWSPAEFNKFIQCVDLVHYRNLFTFLYMTGARKSEALNLQYTDIDGDRVHIRGTKTVTSDRVIIMPDALQRILKPILAHSSDDAPFIFGGSNRLADSTIQAVFTQGIKTAGVKPIRIHDLRHSFASNAIASGCNIVAISKYLGHANINITLTVYAHLLEKTETDMVQRMNNLYQTSIKV